MTVFHNFSHAHAEPAQIRPLLVPSAVGATVVAFAFNALGVWGDGTKGADHSIGDFLIVSAISIVAAAVVFGFVLPRALRMDFPAGTALTLSILGVLTLPIFWAGVTPALAVGGALLGFAGRGVARGQRMSIAAYVLGLLVATAYIAGYVLDWMGTNNIM